MINNPSSSAQVAKNLSIATETGAPPPVTSAQPTLSSREPGPPSMLPPRPSLHAAAKAGDLKAMMYAFTTNRAAINEVDPQTGLTPLGSALDAGHKDAAETLVKLGARVHDLRAAKNGSLHAASELGDPELLGKVLNLSKKDLNARDPISGLTPLSFALRGNHLDAARMLLEAGADPGEANGDGSLPLARAARANNHEAVQLLLAHDARVNQKEHRGDTALHLAAQNGQDAAVQALINAGANLDLTNEKGNTPLTSAVTRGHIRAMALLLAAEPDLQEMATNMQKILDYAVKKGKVTMVEFLLQRGIRADDKLRKSAEDPLVEELLLHADLLGPVPTGGLDNTPAQSLDGSELMDKLLDTAARNKNAGSWFKYLDNRYVSPTLSFALEEAANHTRAVWASLAGKGQKITPAQQKNWCAGILADLGNTMSRESPYAGSGLAPRTRTVLETIATKQTQAMATAAASAEQPLREGMANLLDNCRKAVSDDQFYPIDLFKLLTEDYGIYHGVASLIVSAFSDVWPRRNGLGDASLERAFAEKLSALKGSQKALKDMNSGTATAGNQATVNMLMFRQLDLLQGWIDKWLGR